jgi:predicted aldo/keto reductase-like oxidoreductase
LEVNEHHEPCDYGQAQKNVLTEEEDALFVCAKAAYKSKIRVPCTGCEYCIPCPQGVAIPRIFSRYNESAIYDVWDEGRRSYKRLVTDNRDASKCVQCGQCESKCPQHIPIIEMLQNADADLR